MKNAYELLCEKETDILRVRQEIEALRLSFRCSSTSDIKLTMRLQNCRHPILRGLELLERNSGRGESFRVLGVLREGNEGHETGQVSFSRLGITLEWLLATPVPD
jgi:hypothetical protein